MEQKDTELKTADEFISDLSIILLGWAMFERDKSPLQLVEEISIEVANYLQAKKEKEESNGV